MEYSHTVLPKAPPGHGHWSLGRHICSLCFPAARQSRNGFEMTALPPDVVADLRQENARLQAELRAARDRQNATADILRTIAGISGDAESSLYQIAETSMHLFGATSATIQIAEGDGWSQIIR